MWKRLCNFHDNHKVQRLDLSNPETIKKIQDRNNLYPIGRYLYISKPTNNLSSKPQKTTPNTPKALKQNKSINQAIPNWKQPLGCKTHQRPGQQKWDFGIIEK